MKIFIMSAAVFLVAAGSANAYVDPGGLGQGVFQYLLAGFLALYFSVDSGFKKLKKFFSGSGTDESKPEERADKK